MISRSQINFKMGSYKILDITAIYLSNTMWTCRWDTEVLEERTASTFRF